MKPHDESSKIRKEMIQVWVPRKRMNRPFPLRWGLASLGLLVIFAIVTQFQFNRISADKFYDAKIDTYNVEVTVYNDAIRKNEECLTSIGVREIYRGLFDNVAKLFQKTADAPVELFPQSEVALAYQKTLREDTQTFIIDVMAQSLLPKSVADCPPYPTNIPVRPTRS